MNRFLKENWFKLGILFVFLVVGSSIAYYFFAVLPKDKIIDLDVRNEQLLLNKGETRRVTQEQRQERTRTDVDQLNEYYSLIASYLQAFDQVDAAVKDVEYDRNTTGAIINIRISPQFTILIDRLNTILIKSKGISFVKDKKINESLSIFRVAVISFREAVEILVKSYQVERDNNLDIWKDQYTYIMNHGSGGMSEIAFKIEENKRMVNQIRGEYWAKLLASIDDEINSLNIFEAAINTFYEKENNPNLSASLEEYFLKQRKYLDYLRKEIQAQI